MKVDLRTVESTVAFVDNVVHAKLVESGLETLLRSLPIFVGAHRILRTRGKFDMVRKAEVVVDRRDEVRHAHDFIGELLRRQRDAHRPG